MNDIKVKRELVEYIIRECVRVILEDETVGAPAPPAAGQGTADTPAIPKDQNTMAGTGLYFINPKKNNEAQKINIQYTNDFELEKQLYRLASAAAGPKVKVSGAALRTAKQAKVSPVYLYIGKYDVDSEDVFLLATKNQAEAKSNSLNVQTSYDTTARSPSNSTEQDILKQVGQEPTADPDTEYSSPDRMNEHSHKPSKLISRLIKEAIAELRKED